MSETTKVDYRQMWQDLGLDLKAHDKLLAALPAMYTEAFLSQENRPAGMEYFDFVMSEVHGLRIKELVDHKAAGGTVVGTFCLYVPEEIVRALGGICIGLCGGAEWAADEVERLIPRNTCALIKSFMGFKMGKVCPYVEACDLVVGETTCDGKKKAYELFGEMAPTHVMELPQMKRPIDRTLWREEISRLIEKLEDVTGRKLTAKNLSKAIIEVNGKRRALERLNRARFATPAPISGKDSLLAVQVAFYDDVPRFTEIVNRIAVELEERARNGEGVAPADARRVIVTGSPMSLPNWKLHGIVERAGAVVVGEELCTGSRYYENPVPEGNNSLEEMLDDLAERYMNINCACFSPNPGRMDDIIRMAQRTGADGIIHYALQFCGPYQIEATLVERAAAIADIPFMRVESDYSPEDLESRRLKTRSGSAGRSPAPELI